MFTHKCPRCVVCGRTATYVLPDYMREVVTRAIMLNDQEVGSERGWLSDDMFRLIMTGVHPKCHEIASVDVKLF